MDLDKTWEECLRMWKWVSERHELTGKESGILKVLWLKNHNKNRVKLRFDCYFCEFANNKQLEGEAECKHCPGRLVSSWFHCERYSTYNWMETPKAFYAKLLELNEKRNATQD